MIGCFYKILLYNQCIVIRFIFFWDSSAVRVSVANFSLALEYDEKNSYLFHYYYELPSLVSKLYSTYYYYA